MRVVEGVVAAVIYMSAAATKVTRLLCTGLLPTDRTTLNYVSIIKMFQLYLKQHVLNIRISNSLKSWEKQKYQIQSGVNSK